MEYLLTFKQFVDKLNKQDSEKKLEKGKQRFQELAGLKKPGTFKNQYAILLVINKPNKTDLLLEHEQYTKFQKTNNRYTKHPENPDIPVKAHYHIVPSNSKKELYAVNLDGTAHHKKNRSHHVPKKEADELRSLGVQIPLNNIIESKQWLMTESMTDNYYTTFLIVDED